MIVFAVLRDLALLVEDPVRISCLQRDIDFGLLIITYFRIDSVNEDVEVMLPRMNYNRMHMLRL
jgi:hypothetical protein